MMNKEIVEYLGNISKNWLYKIIIMKIFNLGFMKIRCKIK